uniref:Uncharacterized protein n=1 Tax=Triticum urartu TaxID=4572 RepID=A0A8R7PJN8_TRIUA
MCLFWMAPNSVTSRLKTASSKSTSFSLLTTSLYPLSSVALYVVLTVPLPRTSVDAPSRSFRSNNWRVIVDPMIEVPTFCVLSRLTCDSAALSAATIPVLGVLSLLSCDGIFSAGATVLTFRVLLLLSIGGVSAGANLFFFPRENRASLPCT